MTTMVRNIPLPRTPRTLIAVVILLTVTLITRGVALFNNRTITFQATPNKVALNDGVCLTRAGERQELCCIGSFTKDSHAVEGDKVDVQVVRDAVYAGVQVYLITDQSK
ncbi:hypothetical protein FHU41_000702 [Psychromicrobium silvestre]|uniref:Uncharacterized protein n=1 Tax=Psychromicrobium silvestre TaxID=1645614 RepID=A0A7Y9LRX3_9MICC|nr:hypothetical protein [Psychromicrobium silvestre]NYE94481.1 hypothetical protein [Psychromicrobium silvestre]